MITHINAFIKKLTKLPYKWAQIYQSSKSFMLLLKPERSHFDFVSDLALFVSFRYSHLTNIKKKPSNDKGAKMACRSAYSRIIWYRLNFQIWEDLAWTSLYVLLKIKKMNTKLQSEIESPYYAIYQLSIHLCYYENYIVYPN